MHILSQDHTKDSMVAEEEEVLINYLSYSSVCRLRRETLVLSLILSLMSNIPRFDVGENFTLGSVFKKKKFNCHYNTSFPNSYKPNK